jgi:hypothetical protein
MANSGRFNKSNWSRVASEDKAIVYLPAVIATQTVSLNNSVVITTAIPFQFKGNGPVEASLPFGQLVQNSTGSPSIDETWLTQATSYSGGTHPSVNIRLSNGGTAAMTVTATTDLLLTQG